MHSYAPYQRTSSNVRRSCESAPALRAADESASGLRSAASDNASPARTHKGIGSGESAAARGQASERDSSLTLRSAADDNSAGMQPGAALRAYVAALDVTTEAVLIFDRTGHVVYANAAAEALFGCGALGGRELSDLYLLERPLLRGMLAELRRTGVWRGQLPLQVDRAQLDVAVALRSVPFAPGRSHHICVVARPRERESSEASAISAVARVAGEIAHDFNNQIAVVLNYSFILLRQLPDDSPLRAHVSEMQSAAWRASQVAQEMLGFGGQRRAETDEIDLNALLGDVKALFTHALREDTQLEQQLGRDLWRVRARRAHLEWLLVELASRMRATLGPIARFCIATANSTASAAGETGDAGDAGEAGDTADAGDTGSTDAPASGILHGSASHGRYASGARADSEHERSVVISVEAQPRRTGRGCDTVRSSRLARDNSGLIPARGGLGSGLEGSNGLRGAELALAHARGELAVQQLPDGGMRYCIRLPAV